MTRSVAAVLLGAVLLTAAAFAAAPPTVIPVAVTLAPDALVIGGPGEWVTAHTDIRYSIVDRLSVELSGVSAHSVYPDNRGYMVAKFHQVEIESIVSPPSATLTLTGCTVDGVRFAGSDTIRVMNSQKK